MKILQSKEITQNSKLKTQNLLPDFWSRQTNAQTELFEFEPFGIPSIITANRPDLLAAARLSAGRFSQAAATEANGQPMRLQLVVRSDATGPLPADLPERLVYSGVGQWITVSAGAWGHGFANLDSREAVVFLSPALATETRLVSRYFSDHYLLNFLLTDWAMLHASCLLAPDRQRLIVMIAPHNSGKSTTALHLLRAGYHFLADGMTLFRRDRREIDDSPPLTPCFSAVGGQPSAVYLPRGQQSHNFIVGGYPIGEVKLRDDVLPLFPDYTGETVRVREQRKTVVNLRAAHAGQLVETVINPAAIHLCLVERSSGAQTRLEPLSPEQIWPHLLANTVYWAEPERLTANNDALRTLLRVAALHRFELGTDVSGVVASINSLAEK